MRFKPTPTPQVMAMWEYLGKLHPPLLPTAGINWRDYIKSGGIAKHIG